MGRVEDLEEAITCHRQALALFPHGYLNRSTSLNNLATAMSTRFEQLGKTDDLEESITCHGQALVLQVHDHPGRSSSLNKLAYAVSARIKQSGSKADLLDTVKYFSEAKNILPTGHSHQSSVGLSLAILLINSVVISPNWKKAFTVTKAFELFEHAANHSPASAKERFDAAVG